MVYPLIWMVGATFKTNNEIFSSAWFIPKEPTLSGYENAMKSYGGDIDLIKAMLNTYSLRLFPLRLQLTDLQDLSSREKEFCLRS